MFREVGVYAQYQMVSSTNYRVFHPSTYAFFKKSKTNFPLSSDASPERGEITVCLVEAAGSTHPLPDFCFPNVLLLPLWAREM